MSTSDMKKARAWAEEVGRLGGLMPGPRAAVEVIQSIPDQWIDADKLRQIIDFQGTSISEEARKDLESLITPPLPTLADMTPEERTECEWMQCDHPALDEPGVILQVWENGCRVVSREGSVETEALNHVTPLPDLPRLEWPAQEPRIPENPPAETLNNASSDTPRNPRPEDVPAGEPWLILHNGHGWVGARDSRDGANYPWSLARLDGIKIISSKDLEVTLITRLVPEDKP